MDLLVTDAFVQKALRCMGPDQGFKPLLGILTSFLPMWRYAAGERRNNTWEKFTRPSFVWRRLWLWLRYKMVPNYLIAFLVTAEAHPHCQRHIVMRSRLMYAYCAFILLGVHFVFIIATYVGIFRCSHQSIRNQEPGHRATAVAQPVQQQWQIPVIVPIGSNPGSLVQAQTPEGVLMQATVPAGVPPGGVFIFRYVAPVQQEVSGEAIVHQHMRAHDEVVEPEYVYNYIALEGRSFTCLLRGLIHSMTVLDMAGVVLVACLNASVAHDVFSFILSIRVSLAFDTTFYIGLLQVLALTDAILETLSMFITAQQIFHQSLNAANDFEPEAPECIGKALQGDAEGTLNAPVQDPICQSQQCDGGASPTTRHLHDVVVPHGAGPQFHANVGGQLVMVTVPPGCGPGSTLRLG